MNNIAYGTAPGPVRTDYAVVPSRFWKRLASLEARRTGTEGVASAVEVRQTWW
jgi:hypothetical protein